MPTDIPTPAEVQRVVDYLQAQNAAAGEALVAQRKAASELEEAALEAYFVGPDAKPVADLIFERTDFDDTSLSYEDRGKLLSATIAFDDGVKLKIQAVDPNQELTITRLEAP